MVGFGLEAIARDCALYYFVSSGLILKITRSQNGLPRYNNGRVRLIAAHLGEFRVSTCLGGKVKISTEFRVMEHFLKAGRNEVSHIPRDDFDSSRIVRC